MKALLGKNFPDLRRYHMKVAPKSEAKAKELGLSKFFAENKTQTGSLTIIDPATGKILSQYRNNPDKTAYTTVLDQAIASK